jgi:tetratricopeptide (TPR) repeat protein
MASVFLSYGRGDAAKARPLAAALEKAGHSVWWDQHIGGGSQFSKEIEQALNGADVVVVLWSPASIDSAWVRDEAGAGRDRGRLVPLSVEGTLPPLGFRQFQSIDLGVWSGRGRVPHLPEILEAIERPADKRIAPNYPVGQQRREPSLTAWLLTAVGITMFFIVVGLMIGRPWEHRSSSEPTVAVMAADASPRSRAAASDLFVKLGGLAQVGGGKWRLLDAADQAKPDLILRMSDTGSDAHPQTSLALLDGPDRSLLWSRELTFPAGQQADLRQQLALTAGRVLGCALDSREQDQLSVDLLKLFLDTCAPLTDVDANNGDRIAFQLRRIIDSAPEFRPAWGPLLSAEASAIDTARFTDAAPPLRQQLKIDVARARRLFPDLPELAIAELRLQDRVDYGRAIDSLKLAAERTPDNAQLRAELSHALMDVGRMDDAIDNSRRAAALDPLSPAGTVDYIMILAHGGQIDAARDELAKAEKLWAGTAALRDAEIGFLTRYGDPNAALKLDTTGYNTAFYLAARADPSPRTIARLKAGIDEFRPKQVNSSQVAWAIQGLAEFNLVDDVFYWLGRLPTDQAASISGILFRPALASARRDPRFMPLSSRLGLVRYWKSSGKWPDFCRRPGIPYDCETVAATFK